MARLLNDISGEAAQSATAPSPAASTTQTVKSTDNAAIHPPSSETAAKGTEKAPTSETVVQPSAKPALSEPARPPSDEVLRKKIEQSRLFAYALDATKLGVWRFTEGSTMTPDQVIQRLQSGPAIEVVGGLDNGQRMFNRALHGTDANLRRGAVALIRVANDGVDYGYQPDQPGDQNESAIQQITSFLTTQRGKVISQLGTKTQ
jgi:hypothetical protein